MYVCMYVCIERGRDRGTETFHLSLTIAETPSIWKPFCMLPNPARHAQVIEAHVLCEVRGHAYTATDFTERLEAGLPRLGS